MQSGDESRNLFLTSEARGAALVHYPNPKFRSFWLSSKPNPKRGSRIERDTNPSGEGDSHGSTYVCEYRSCGRRELASGGRRSCAADTQGEKCRPHTRPFRGRVVLVRSHRALQAKGIQATAVQNPLTTLK